MMRFHTGAIGATHFDAMQQMFTRREIAGDIADTTDVTARGAT